MRRLLPEPGEADLEALLRDLEPAAEPPPDRPWVVSNFAVTWDGRATIGGRAGPIGSDADQRLLQRLRARADAVVVGAGTVRVERYGPLLGDEELRRERSAAGRPPDPLAVVPSGTLALPWEAGLFSSGRGEVLLLTTEGRQPPETETPLAVRSFPGRADPAAALAELRAERDIRLVVCEGGPHLHGELLALDLVDELFVTIAPKVAGGEGPNLAEGLAEGQRPLRPVWLLEREGELFARLSLRS